MPLPDLQETPDERNIAIERVGVCDLKYPITVLDKENKQQNVAGTFSLSVDLPRDFKGTHMSRFIEVLNEHRGEVTMHTVPSILDHLLQKLEAKSTHLEVSFPYFIEKLAPVSKKPAFMDYECGFSAEKNQEGQNFVIVVRIPVTSLCPCSKAISDYGAHNQRGIVEVQVRSKNEELVWFEEIVNYAEESASAPLYSLLKREDERHVTMQAFDNPAFVEDIARDLAVRLRDDNRIEWYRVKVINHESIHNHSAFAVVSSETA